MYATVDEIKARSRNVPPVLTATPSDLSDYMDEAATEIHTFCSQDFLFEAQTTKRVLLVSSLVVLPKFLSGKVSVTLSGGGQVISDDLEHFAGENILRYRPLNVVDWTPTNGRPEVLLVTGDWGFAPSNEYLLIAYANELKAKYNTHRLDTEAHSAADTINVITSADADDLNTAIVLLNEAKDVLNAHFADTLVHPVADSDVITAASATDEPTAITLASDLDAKWNEHVHDTDSHVGETSEEDHTTLSVDNPILPNAIKRTFMRLVKRIAIRDDAEDIYNHNSGFAKETSGDGYEADLSNGTLRNLIQPRDYAALLPYVHDGVVVS